MGIAGDLLIGIVLSGALAGLYILVFDMAVEENNSTKMLTMVMLLVLCLVALFVILGILRTNGL